MKRSQRRQAVVLSFLVLAAWIAAQAAVPPLRGYVNDYAEILSPQEEQLLTQKLAAFERETTNQLVILTVPSLEGKDIESYSIEVAEAWKIGQKGKDNGVIIVVAPKERRYRIEIGYGLEPVLPDGLVGEIGRRALVPAFRQGRYGEGLSAAVDLLIAASRGEFQAEGRESTGTRPVRRRVSQPLVQLLVLSLLFWGIVCLVSGGSRRRRTVIGRGRSGTPWFGGPWFGGGFGGGGFSGGGFSGGGGGFGGGGASGRW